MIISIRFQGRPLPTNNKIYGINTYQDFPKKLVYQYSHQYSIKETGALYKIVFPLIQNKKTYSTSKKNTSARFTSIQRPIMAFATLY